MPSSTTLGLPIPADSDPVSDGALAMRNLASALDRKIIVKPADTSNATVNAAADPHFVFPLKAGKTYIWSAHLLCIAAASTIDFKVGPTVPANSLLAWSAFGLDPAIGSGNVGSATFIGSSVVTVIPVGVSSVLTPVLFSGCITPTADGNLGMQWAQVTANASPITLKAGSWMRAEAV